MSNITGWSRGLEVSGGGQGVVSQAGLVLLRHLANKTGLAGGLSRAVRSAGDRPIRSEAPGPPRSPPAA